MGSYMNKIALSIALFIVSPVILLADLYESDIHHSSVNFNAIHFKISTIRGRFTNFSSTFDYNDKTHAITELDALIKVESVMTDVKPRDDHLRSPDFFDATHNKEITFKQSEFIKAGENKGKVKGELTIKGIKKIVELDYLYKGMQGHKIMAFSLTDKINRNDFNVGKTIPQNVVGEEIAILIDIEAGEVKK